jgi:hypothetical protein
VKLVLQVKLLLSLLLLLLLLLPVVPPGVLFAERPSSALLPSGDSTSMIT